MEQFLYTFADPLAFEDIGRWRADPSDPRFTRLETGAVDLADAAGWTTRMAGFWTIVHPEGVPVTGQGWKVHVAVTPTTLQQVVDLVAQTCRRRGIPFKFLSRREYAWIINAKYAPRQASGKGVAIYPPDTEASVDLADELSAVLADLRGPRILTDVQVGSSVVHARYGAYAKEFCRRPDASVGLAMRSPDGALVPDERRVPFRLPDFVTPPDLFRPEGSGALASSEGPVPPYRVDKTLHLSNAGGVYLATNTTTGRQVVLKEGRPHAGYDLIGGDAVSRVRAEVTVMRQFAGHPGFPEVYDDFTWQGHHFGVIEYIRGTTLQEWCHARQPFIMRPDPYSSAPTEDVHRFRDDVLGLLEQVRSAVQHLWDAGHVFGDHHTGNVMVGEDRHVTLVDFEACRPTDAPRPFPGALGFCRSDLQGLEADRYGLAMLELACFVPLTELKHLDRRTLPRLIDLVDKRYTMPAGWRTDMLDRCGTDRDSVAPAVHPVTQGFVGWAGRVVDGLRSGMTPDRSDRLFRFDTSGFGLPASCLATGAAGVLWSLGGLPTELRAVVEPATVNWLTARATHDRDRIQCGLYDSELGAAYALWSAGHQNRAGDIAAGALAKVDSTCGPTVFSGLGGVYMAVEAMSAGPDAVVESSEVERVGALLTASASRLLEAVRSSPDAVSSYGLMRGTAGVALALHRHGLAAGDDAAVATARELLQAEFHLYVRRPDGSLQFNEADRRSLAYVDVGSLGAALVVRELARHENWTPQGISIDDLVRANGPELMAQVGLFRGRAGFLAGVATFARDGEPGAKALVDRHLDELGLHEIRIGDEIHYPGVRNYRLSADLTTGAAGVLTAVSYALGHRTSWLPGVV